MRALIAWPLTKTNNNNSNNSNNSNSNITKLGSNKSYQIKPRHYNKYNNKLNVGVSLDATTSEKFEVGVSLFFFFCRACRGLLVF